MEDFISILKNLLPKRNKSANKGVFGTLAVVGGSASFRGAPILACEAALRCGIGICRLISTERVIFSASCRLPELTYTVIGENARGGISSSELINCRGVFGRASAVLIGCGMGASFDTEAIVSHVLSNFDGSAVIDADGLNSLRHSPERLLRAKKAPIITPHVGEMARLTGMSVDDIKKNREEVATDFAFKHRCVTVLKDSVTVIASPDGRSFVCRRENSGMAKGGSGDALSGIIASLRCQGLENYEAALCGVLLHSEAGILTSSEMSETSMLPSDVIARLSYVFDETERE